MCPTIAARNKLAKLSESPFLEIIELLLIIIIIKNLTMTTEIFNRKKSC
jgi:hypothetical protein